MGSGDNSYMNQLDAITDAVRAGQANLKGELEPVSKACGLSQWRDDGSGKPAWPRVCRAAVAVGESKIAI